MSALYHDGVIKCNTNTVCQVNLYVLLALYKFWP